MQLFLVTILLVADNCSSRSRCGYGGSFSFFIPQYATSCPCARNNSPVPSVNRVSAFGVEEFVDEKDGHSAFRQYGFYPGKESFRMFRQADGFTVGDQSLVVFNNVLHGDQMTQMADVFFKPFMFDQVR